MTKKQIREKFRNEVFTRDKHTCRLCGDVESKLDAHHIMNRIMFPNGGYVKSNGITLCDKEDGCHFQVEKVLTEILFSSQYKPLSEHPYHPDRLYKLIGSSFEQAKKDDLQNKIKTDGI